jgi:hypothetical protein
MDPTTSFLAHERAHHLRRDAARVRAARHVPRRRRGSHRR